MHQLIGCWTAGIGPQTAITENKPIYCYLWCQLRTASTVTVQCSNQYTSASTGSLKALDAPYTMYIEAPRFKGRCWGS